MVKFSAFLFENVIPAFWQRPIAGTELRLAEQNYFACARDIDGNALYTSKVLQCVLCLKKRRVAENAKADYICADLHGVADCVVAEQPKLELTRPWEADELYGMVMTVAPTAKVRRPVDWSCTFCMSSTTKDIVTCWHCRVESRHRCCVNLESKLGACSAAKNEWICDRCVLETAGFDRMDYVVCGRCGDGDSEDKMLLCDSCSSGYHIFCLVPALTEVEAAALTSWYCPSCIASPGSTESFVRNPNEETYGWLSKPVKNIRDGNNHYRAFAKGDTVISIDDCVEQMADGQPSFVGRVVDLFETAQGEMMISTRWFWRAEDLPTGRLPLHGSNQLFQSEGESTNSLETVLARCQVMAYDKFLQHKAKCNDCAANVPHASRESVYFYRMEFKDRQIFRGERGRLNPSLNPASFGAVSEQRLILAPNEHSLVCPEPGKRSLAVCSLFSGIAGAWGSTMHSCSSI